VVRQRLALRGDAVIPHRVTAAKVVLPFLFIAALAGCRKDSSPQTLARRAEEAPAAGVQGVAAGAGSAPPAKLEGPLAVSKRVILLGVYAASPVAPDVLRATQETVRQRFPGLAVDTAPADAARPGALIVAPDIASFAPPTEHSLEYFARGLDAEQKKAAAASKGVVVLSWGLDADPRFARLREAQNIALELATKVRGFVWDDITRQLFSTEAWKQERVDGWDGDLPNMRQNFAIHYYETEGHRHRAITLGMAKFGLPDLVVSDVPLHESDAMTSLLVALAQLLVEGASVGPGNDVDIHLESIRHAKSREQLIGSAAPGAKLQGHVALFPVFGEEGDPENRLVELRFPSYAGATAPERQAAALTTILDGSTDRIAGAKSDDPELAAVKRRVQARLPVVAAAFRQGLPLGERLSVKAPFPTDDGHIEWMWVSVTSWADDVARGRLENEPSRIQSLKLGAPVEVEQASVADYIWSGADGKKKEGGESIDVLLRREREKAR
jgi:uncharacterized protein YegJ (DUF2314 family)